MCALDHTGREARKGVPIYGALQCVRHTLGVVLSIIILISQMCKNTEKLSNFPKTYTWEVEKSEFCSQTV